MKTPHIADETPQEAHAGHGGELPGIPRGAGVRVTHAHRVAAKGAAGRRARWKVRHDLRRKRKRRPHPARIWRDLRLELATYDALVRRGQLVVTPWREPLSAVASALVSQVSP